MNDYPTAKKSFYASEIEQIKPFSSKKLLEVLSYEFTGMTDSLSDFFSAQNKLNSIDPRRFRYELFMSIPSLSNKLSYICKLLNAAFLKSRDIEIIDYTCSQGMSAVILIEELKNKGVDVSCIKSITIIDPIQQRLENATCHLKAFIPELEVRTVCKMYYQVLPLDLELSSMYSIHLFGDIIERYQYMPLSFAALMKSTRILFDCFIFFKDVQMGKEDRHQYSSEDENCISERNLLYRSSQLVDLIESDRIAGGLEKDDNGFEWAFQIYGNHSLSNLFLPNSEDEVHDLVVDDFITRHITHQRVLYYRDDLLPQTKPFDRKDIMRSLHENDLTVIEENFLIYKIADLYSSNPDAFCKIVARYKELTEKGCYEAYNNLGVIKIMSEYTLEEDGSDEYVFDEANKLFLKAAEHGSTNAMLNLLSYYCGKENHERANYYIDKLMENNEDLGYWEKATSLFLGIHEPQNIELAKSYYKLLLECIPGNNWPRGGYRNPAIFNLSKFDLESPSTDDLINILMNLETCSQPLAEQKILKAVVLAKLGLKKNAFEEFNRVLNDLDNGKTSERNKYVLYYNLGVCYMYGIGCKKNYKTAEFYFKKTLEKNAEQEPFYARGFRGIGNLYYKMGRLEEAREYYSIALEYDKDFYCAARTNLAVLEKEDKCLIAKELLDSNNGCFSCHEANNYDRKKRLCPKCQVWLLSGKNLDDDNVNTAIIDCLQDSAKQGYPAAQFLLGKLLIDSDVKTAKEWLSSAAKQGDTDAQFYLYLISKDKAYNKYPSNQAVKWLALSAQSRADSQLLLYCEYQINKIPGDSKDIVNWLVQAALNGSSQAEFTLGSKFYDIGKQNYGIQLLVRAANNGQKDAIDWLEKKKLESSDLKKQIAKVQYANSELTQVTKEEKYQHGSPKENGLIYSSDNTRLLFYFGYYGDEAHINEGTVCICDDCFNDRYDETDYNYLQTIFLPKSLQYIGQNAFNVVLTNIYSASENFIVEGSALFSKDKKVLIRYFGKDEEYTVPDGVEKIEGGALWATELKTIHLPASLTIMNGNPFLTDDPSSFPTVTSQSNIITAVDGLITDVIDKKIVAYLGKDRNLIIPDGIVELGRDCFLGSEIESIFLPKSLSKVDKSSFYQCFNLKEIHVPHARKRVYMELLPQYLIEYIFEDNTDGEGDKGSIVDAGKIIIKEDAAQIERYLKENTVRCFYHFTDRKNLESIKKNGGLYSWAYCKKNNISIPVPGGSSRSRSLDIRYHLEDYVRLSFCEDHPMAFRLLEEGADLVLLKINTVVATLKDTLFSDINATDNNHHHGGKLDDLKRVDIQATKQTFVSKESPIFKKHQAEVLVKTHIPLEYIINLDNPLAL